MRFLFRITFDRHGPATYNRMPPLCSVLGEHSFLE